MIATCVFCNIIFFIIVADVIDAIRQTLLSIHRDIILIFSYFKS